MNPQPLLAGILEPVFAIRTEDDLGVGDTEGVRQMIHWCARHRLNIFQTLPINETSDDHSPYNAISSLALEPGTLARRCRRRQSKGKPDHSAGHRNSFGRDWKTGRFHAPFFTLSACG